MYVDKASSTVLYTYIIHESECVCNEHAYTVVGFCSLNAVTIYVHMTQEPIILRTVLCKAHSVTYLVINGVVENGFR